MSILVLQSSWWGRESWLLYLICPPGVSWWLSGSSSRCHEVVCGLWLWYFLIILTYYFWASLASLPCDRWARHIYPSFVLVQPRKTHPCSTERFVMGRKHAREPLYSNSAVIAWCSQSTGAQNILFWFTVVHSTSQFFTTFSFHDVFFIWNYCLGIVVHSGPIRAFKF